MTASDEHSEIEVWRREGTGRWVIEMGDDVAFASISWRNSKRSAKRVFASFQSKDYLLI
jgi:hypothetical protein